MLSADAGVHSALTARYRRYPSRKRLTTRIRTHEFVCIIEPGINWSLQTKRHVADGKKAPSVRSVRDHGSARRLLPLPKRRFFTLVRGPRGAGSTRDTSAQVLQCEPLTLQSFRLQVVEDRALSRTIPSLASGRKQPQILPFWRL